MLREAGAGEEEQMAALLDHDPAAHADLSIPADVVGLLQDLREAGAREQVTVLTGRLPAAGLFGLFLEQGDHGVRFRFGREPDGSPAPPWGWADLD